MATRLSENKVGGNYTGASFDSRDFTHCNSIAAAAIAQYSALVEEQTIVHCFVELQEIGLAPRKLKKVPVEVRSSRLLAQSVSEKPCKARGVFARSRISRDLVPLR